jgi:A/G-specific adenine glycosylase
MDIGATVCRSARPQCEQCPLRSWCRFAADRSVVDSRPETTRSRGPAPPFPATTRWLRGRIVDRLREADGPSWTVVMAPIGEHDAAAIERALAALARDGIVERDPIEGRRARLATA